MKRQETCVRDVEDFRPRVERRRGDDNRGRRPRSPPDIVVTVVVVVVVIAETDDPTYAVVPKVRVDVSPVALDPFHGSVPVVAGSSVVVAVGIAAAVVVAHSPSPGLRSTVGDIYSMWIA